MKPAILAGFLRREDEKLEAAQVPSPNRHPVVTQLKLCGGPARDMLAA
jgi:hypothetical protein